MVVIDVTLGPREASACEAKADDAGTVQTQVKACKQQLFVLTEVIVRGHLLLQSIIPLKPVCNDNDRSFQACREH